MATESGLSELMKVCNCMEGVIVHEDTFLILSDPLIKENAISIM
jgi:hypothetical protein